MATLQPWNCFTLAIALFYPGYEAILQGDIREKFQHTIAETMVVESINK